MVARCRDDVMMCMMRILQVVADRVSCVRRSQRPAASHARCARRRVMVMVLVLLLLLWGRRWH